MKNITQQPRIPQLRFKEFDGEWEKKKLGEICSFFSGGTPTSTNKQYYQGEIPFIGSGNISDNKVSNFISQEAFDSSSAKMVEVGDLLYALYGANSGDLAISKMSGAINQAILCIRTKNENIEFIFSLLLSNKERIVCKYLQGGQGNLSSKIIKNLQYYLPSLKEQQKIAAFLTAVDKKISQLTSKKEQLTKYKKGMMQQLFSQELRFKDENGKDFADWEEKRLGEVCEVNPKNSSLPNSFIYVDLESVSKGRLVLKNRMSIEDAPSRAQRILNVNDILFQTVRPYQMNNLYFEFTGDFVASTGYAQLRTQENSMFLYQLLHTDKFVNDVLERCTGTSYPAINSKDLGRIKINIPSLQEQQKIASYLSALDDKIEAVQVQIEKTQEFKKGLLQQLFV